MLRRMALLTLVLALAGCASASGAPGSVPTPSASSAVSSTVSPSASSSSPTPSKTTATPTPTPTPTPVPVLNPGDVKPEVRDLQGRLRQLKLYPSYDLLDNYGPMTEEAVFAYQQARGLPATGKLDSFTWAKLQSETKPVPAAELNNQIPGPAIIGPGSPSIRELQVRLRGSGYAGAIDGQLTPAVTESVKAFQQAQQIAVTGEVDQRTWDYLVWSTPAPAQWQLDGLSAPPVPKSSRHVLSKACLDAVAKYGRAVCASQNQKLVSWVEGDQVLTMTAAFGYGPEYYTNNGSWQFQLKRPNIVSHLFGENIDMPLSMCYDGNFCFHFSAWMLDPTVPHYSHGCVSVGDMDTLRVIYDKVRTRETGNADWIIITQE